ncbi:MAG: nuclease [Alphaproteobacteria bacterium]|nr:nuclease [Alphaproteobacteria bacterium]
MKLTIYTIYNCMLGYAGKDKPMKHAALETTRPAARTIALLFAVVLLCLPAQGQARETLPGPLRGEVLEVLDGDTIAVRLHVWIGQSVETHVRIAGIDAPEIHGKCKSERARAQAAKKALAALLTDGKVTLYNVRLAKYAGRVLAEARSENGQHVATYMIGKGLARPYHGQKRGGWCAAGAR